MKNLVFALCLLFVSGAVMEAQAQLSSKEKKEWKKRKKKMSEEEFKNMFEENSELRGQVNTFRSNLSTLQSRISDKDAKISELTEEIRRLEEQASSMPDPEPMVVQQQQSNGDYDVGVVFRVQIGAFQGQDMSEYFENTENFSGETDESGLQKITLGVFRDYWQADTFKKRLREMGVKEAWVVPFKDGVRVPMKDVLEGVI